MRRLIGYAVVLSFALAMAGCSLFTSANPSIEVLTESTLTTACNPPTNNANACALNNFMTQWCDGAIVLPVSVPGYATLVCTELGYSIAPKMAAASATH